MKQLTISVAEADWQVKGVFVDFASAYPFRVLGQTPQKTADRLRRALGQVSFPSSYAVDERIQNKASCTAHLPKGIAAHRRIPRMLPPD